MAQKFRRIIAPVDGSNTSREAAETAIQLAKNSKLDVIALYVLDMGVYTGTLPADQGYTFWKDKLTQEGNKTLNDLEAYGKEHGVKVYTEIREGIPDDEITKEAGETDLIVMGSKGKSALDRIFIGSVSEKVLHHASSPVMIIR